MAPDDHDSCDESDQELLNATLELETAPSRHLVLMGDNELLPGDNEVIVDDNEVILNAKGKCYEVHST